MFTTMQCKLAGECSAGMKSRVGILVSLCGILTGLSPVSLSAAGVDQPNVLMICVDDMNDWSGCLAGHPQARTPNIDKLAERGLLLTNAHSPATTCNPARTAVLTGLRPSTTGVYANAQWWRPVLLDAIGIYTSGGLFWAG